METCLVFGFGAAAASAGLSAASAVTTKAFTITFSVAVTSIFMITLRVLKLNLILRKCRLVSAPEFQFVDDVVAIVLHRKILVRCGRDRFSWRRRRMAPAWL